jgi:hypothetical protein
MQTHIPLLNEPSAVGSEMASGVLVNSSNQSKVNTLGVSVN